MHHFKEKGIQFKSLKEGLLDTTSPMGEVVFQIIAILKAMEVEVLRERTKDGLTAAVPEEEMVAGKKATMKKGKLLPQPRYIKKINIQ